MKDRRFSVVLLRPEIPHNTGAIGRLCVGLGVKLNLIRPLGFAHVSSIPKMFRFPPYRVAPVRTA